jgi:hypothetical protein
MPEEHEGTLYVVLEQVDAVIEERVGPDGDEVAREEKVSVWVEVGRYPGGGRAAIRRVIEARDGKGGTFAAVPERSWQPTPAHPATQTIISWT